jgi:hypothetical protein
MTELVICQDCMSTPLDLERIAERLRVRQERDAETKDRT